MRNVPVLVAVFIVLALGSLLLNGCEADYRWKLYVDNEAGKRELAAFIFRGDCERARYRLARDNQYVIYTCVRV